MHVLGWQRYSGVGVWLERLRQWFTANERLTRALRGKKR